MSERDDYIPGVPCWVDASYKDPESVLPFYRGLFGREFIPAIETPGERFFIATIHGGSTAGIGELPADHPAVPAWNTYIAVTSADEAVAKVQAAGGRCSHRRSTSLTPAGWRSSGTRRARCSASGRPAAPRVRRSSMSTAPSTSTRSIPPTWSGQEVLRRGVRLDHAVTRGRGVLDAAGLRRLS